MQNNEQNGNQNGNQNQPVNWGENRGVSPKNNSADVNLGFFDKAFKKLPDLNPRNNGGELQSNQGVSVQQVGEGGGYQNPNSETATAGDGRNVRRRIAEEQGSPSNFQAVRNNSPISASTTPTGAGAGAGAGGVAGAVTNQGQAPVTPPDEIVVLGNAFLVGTPKTANKR